MGRGLRIWVSESVGAYHIMSRVAGGELLFNDIHKNYFLKLLEIFAAGFFVRIHAFAIMGNHFHILVTTMDQEAIFATKEELLCRYRLMYGKDEFPPPGRFDKNGNLLPDDDEGYERLRERLSSVSRFMQELKQTFSRWYNKQNNRKGYLWGDRFKSIIVYTGDIQLICSAYIDLNPVRAGLVILPEAYKWSSIGLRVMFPERAKKLLHPLPQKQKPMNSVLPLSSANRPQVDYNQLDFYLECLYFCGDVKSDKKKSAPENTRKQAVACIDRLGIGYKLNKRIRNLSEGIAVGDYNSISNLQKSEERKFIRPRYFLDSQWLCSTRTLRN